MSLALKLLMATLRLLPVAGRLKAVTVGAKMSMVVVALRLAEILPARSRAKA